ncbi:proheparin-binding EGF-like growth factor isoform X2 [Pteropus medius]|nr:proheparin-binding EGF-like growth factor isoform X2 [Pteropus giganteus]
MVETPGLVQGWPSRRNEGREGTRGIQRQSSAQQFTRLQRDKGLGKGRNWSPPPAGHQPYPQSGRGCPGLVSKNVSTAPTPAPFPAAPAGSGAALQAPGAGRASQRGRGRGRCGAGRGAELRRRLPEPYPRPRAGSAQSTEGAARCKRLVSLTAAQRLGRTDRRTHARTDGVSRQTPSGCELRAGPSLSCTQRPAAEPCPAESPALRPPRLSCQRPGAAASKVITASSSPPGPGP